MKKLVLFVLLLISVVANAQKGVSYQAVILDPSKIEIPGQDITGQPYVNGNVWVKFTILSGTTSQFEEVQQTKSDAYGLVNLTIGSVASTAFNSMTWDANQKTLQVSVSFNSGASYTKVSDQKLTYTPYALFAETAGKLGSTLGIAGGGTGATTAVGARANLGLGNVDNTADADKPISTATQAALDLKVNALDLTNLNTKVNSNTAGITANTSAITAEVNRATSAELTLTNSLAANTISIASNTTSITANTSAIVAEVNRASASELALTNRVTANTASITANTSSITAEINRATAAELVITNSVAANTTSIDSNTASITANTSSITAEINRATAAELALTNSVVANTTSIDSNTASIIVNTSAISAEADRATAAELALTNSVAANTASITTTIANLNAKASIASPTFTGTLTAPTIVKSGGLATQFLMADGSVTTATTINEFSTDIKVNGLNVGKGNGQIATNTSVGINALSSNTTGYFNVGIGDDVLKRNTTGFENTSIGHVALINNTTGSFNTAIGKESLARNTVGESNTAVGVNSLASNINGGTNIAIGNNSQINNQSGNNNTAVGFGSLGVNQTGSNLTSLGKNADVTVDGLTNATAIGFDAKVSTSNSIQLGNQLVEKVSTSGKLTLGNVTYPNSVGNNGQVLTSTNSGILTWTSILTNNVADAATLSGTVAIAKGGTGATTATDARTNLGLRIGADVQAPLTAGTDYLTPTGSAAGLTSFPTLNQNTTGNAATATLADNISATTNTTLTSLENLTTVGTITSGTINLTTDISTTGTLRAGNNIYPNSNGSNGQFLTTDGSGTLSWSSIPVTDLTNYVTLNTSQTISEAKAFSKDLTVNGLTVGKGRGNKDNTAMGIGALNAIGSTVTGQSNTAIGKNALFANTTGAANVAIGQAALTTNTDGGSNVAIGTESLRYNVSSSQNTAIGRDALENFVATGTANNTAIGYRALWGNGSSTGTGNTAIGSFAGSSVTTGSNNIVVGGGDGVADGSNNTLIGVNARVSNGSLTNSTVIGYNSAVSAANATAIGSGAIATVENTIQLGNTDVINVNTSGTLTAGAVTYPNAHGTTGQILSSTGSGTLTWTNTNGFTHYVGEDFGGGIVVYVYKTNGVEHGLIVSKSDVSTSTTWSSVTNSASGASSRIDGQSNTASIIAQNSGAASAAQICDDLVLNGYSDWYLPALAEFGFVWKLKDVIEIYGSDLITGNNYAYYTSTEVDANYVYLYSNAGSPSRGPLYQGKGNIIRVRAMRKF